VPLDEPPNLVSLLGALERRVISEIYLRLDQAGFRGLRPASAPIFQFVRPGGSSIEEIARLAQLSGETALAEARALEEAGYARVEAAADHPELQVELTARGEAAAALGLQVVAETEARWREILGETDFSNFLAGAARLMLARGT
jgi:DNA-binding MarR family transcriptional regulator